MLNSPSARSSIFDLQSPATWRLIVDAEPRSGAANMALDQAVAEAVAAGESLPTLRFYRWLPPTVSLGRHQPVAEVDKAAIAAAGYELVRRPTGGRAILHVDELTYSIAAPADEPRVRGGVMDAYLRLSEALVLGLRSLGLAGVEKAPGHVRTGQDVSAACFEVPSAYEITAGGRKLMGSAQSRRAGYVLQHGSLPLVGDILRLIDVLVLEPAAAEALRVELDQRACTLAAALGVADDDPAVDFAAVQVALAEGFADALALDFKPAPPSPPNYAAPACLFVNSLLIRRGPRRAKVMAAIALLTIELYLPLNQSLKGKRSILKPLIARLRRDFNVSVCEADAQDMHSRAVLEIVCVSQNSALAHRQLQNVANRVEDWRMDAQLVDYWIEMIG